MFFTGNLCSQFENTMKNNEYRKINFISIQEFQKDSDKLGFASLSKDLELLQKYLRVNPRGRPPIVVRCSGLGQSLEAEIYKVREFRCTSMKGKGRRSGIRVIYAYIPDDKTDGTIIFIEMYFKGKKDNFDKKRVLQYFHKETGLYYTAK